MIVSDVTLAGFCWGDFWSMYGAQWVKTVSSLDPFPERVVLFCDRKVDLPAGWEQRETKSRTVWDFFNNDLPDSGTEYVANLMMDDGMPPDALSELVLGSDVIASGHLDSLGNTNIPTKEKYENCLDEPWYPLSGYQVIRSSLLKRIPMRPVDWADWIQMFEWYQHGASIHFDGKIRQHYTVRPGQYSQPKDIQKARDNINLMRDLIRSGGVKPGAIWPPEPA